MAEEESLHYDDHATRRFDPDDRPTIRGLTAGQVVFGRYRLESVAGRGGMGVVWRANDEKLGEIVALKFLPEVVAHDAVAIDELKVETKRARRLRHPNIVTVFNFEEDEARVAVSMEYVDGSTLSQLRLNQPGKVFSPDNLAPLVAQLCTALDYAHHEAKIVHRDLKPANLLVTPDGQLRVTDFGIARSISETTTRLTSKASSETSGTLAYMSPQQLNAEKTTAADDIYALGATLYELMTGKPPFSGNNAAIVMEQIRTRAPTPLAQRRAEVAAQNEVTDLLPRIPLQWEKIILACLAKAPGKRPKNVREVASQLGMRGRKKTSTEKLVSREVSESTVRLVAGQKVFSRYTIESRVGDGGMGVVLLARDETLETEVALKFLHESVAKDTAAVNDLKRETRRIRQLTHPNIVRIFDLLQDEHSVAISMEYLEGSTLLQLRRARPNQIFEVADLGKWVKQLCEALDYAHNEAKVVHRDLKPANLMIDVQGDLKITDFGITEHRII